MGGQGQSFNYPRAQASALRLIDNFGQAGSIVRDVPGSGPEWDPGEPVPTAYPCTLAVLNFDNKDIDGTLIKASDKKVYIASKGLTIVPETTDRLTIGDISHTIIRVMPLNPAGVNVYFEVQARA
ncbi:hypothetical protein CU102_12720 [Phyllobacterium brassicacearum]|uniref:Uncharacterized protein n=1 Tax=Phyllobacterium brassicacearum TaxID=314235 RepID=A0A2P7BQ57_9HYPH|nr:hypothetical protein [Phyllobacterium brassicacearum]PSH68617.1 hypothetical protein CU102_12720 [Phyllobacterium brassicacearum]TDQ24167.1 hypothetical protein DEV91_11545 [Phyllobacterium brassicacearum]